MYTEHLHNLLVKVKTNPTWAGLIFEVSSAAKNATWD
jgi:hypothetical protein